MKIELKGLKIEGVEIESLSMEISVDETIEMANKLGIDFNDLSSTALPVTSNKKDMNKIIEIVKSKKEEEKKISLKKDRLVYGDDEDFNSYTKELEILESEYEDKIQSIKKDFNEKSEKTQQEIHKLCEERKKIRKEIKNIIKSLSKKEQDILFESLR